MNGFRWAGDIGEGTDQTVCWINHKVNEVEETDICDYEKLVGHKKKKKRVKRPLVNIVHLTDVKQILQTISYDDEWTGDINNNADEGENNFACRIKRKKRKTFCAHKTMVTNQNVKLISEAVFNVPFLFDFTYKFSTAMGRIEEVNYKILVCTKKYRKNLANLKKKLLFDDGVKIITYSYDSCEQELKDDVIAVLAPSPEMIDETDKPVIFYEQPFPVPEATASYKNSIIPHSVRSMEPYSYALLEFIKEMNWHRVAVVSDGSTESIAYEELLRKLFYEEGLAHQFMTVTETNRNGYDFSEVSLFGKPTKKRRQLRIITIRKKNVL